jgi:cobalt-zinc-cadmium resistance protein CzcA
VYWLLGRRLVVVACLLVLVAATTVVGRRLGSEFLPQLDEGDFVIFIEMPPSIALDKGSDVLREVRRRILMFPETASVLSEQGRPEDGTDDQNVNMSETFVRLMPRDKWRAGWDKDRLIEAMRSSLTELPGVSFNFSQPIKDNVEEAVSGVRGQVVLKIFGTDLTVMKSTLERCLGALKDVPGVVDLGLYRDTTVPQLQVILDRPALARAGITVGAAQDVVETALSGRVVTQMWESERPVPIRVLLPTAERDEAGRIGDILVPTVNGSRVPLREIAKIEQAPGRAAINREANSRLLALKFNVEGRDLGSVVADAQAAVAKKVKVPEGNFLQWAGEFENQKRAMTRLAVIVPLSAIVVFGLLYSALGSLPSAITILIVTPFAMTGGVFALALAGIPLSVSAAVGFIALLGQACLASLLVVSVIDARRRGGEELTPAVSAGAASRFRVVLMTALLAILGLLPAAISTGVGSETQRPFAVVIIGGLITAVPVTLFALPVLYSLVVRKVPALSSDSDIAWDAGEVTAP